MRKKRIAGMILSICLAAGLSACGEKMEDGADMYYEGSLKSESTAGGEVMNGSMAAGSITEGMADGGAGSIAGEGAGSIAEGSAEGAALDMPRGTPAPGGDATGSPAEAVGSDMLFDAEPDMIEVETEEFDEQIPPRAGLLTAGEWRDNENWGFFTNLVYGGRFTFEQFGIAPYQRVVVQAFSEGTPAGKIKVQLCNVTGSAIAAAVTDHNGKAYLYYNIYGGTETPDCVVLEKPDGSKVQVLLTEEETGTGNEADGQSESSAANPAQEQNGQQNRLSARAVTSREITVELGSLEAPVRALDLMFVFDTTGSMGDELMYLQKEFEDIAGRVADQSTRFSVNFYRDKGDDYVVRSNPFSADIQAVSALINAESADGGGDYEEAVDEALLDAVINHEWRENAVKLLFLILDAPPHDTPETAANLKAVADAAMEQGIRIIPIASSGVNEKTEGFLRSLAMLTGGTYTFLTDDSGVGGRHLEPTVGAYTVEALNELIVRLVKEYYGE